ncbi:MAG: nucleotidyl transferase AbiEii/AbiGii toxin family protein [Caldilineaceae bacterium]|nr:nucleotidyl transferase AbiEii/AbiGii toxin family protein [Caldilineaceae bacterium]
MIGSYATPHAFRTALEARLRNLSLEQGTDLQRLRRQVAFERLLARLFREQDARSAELTSMPWLLKGGYALELRLPDRSRSTVDLDFSVPNPAGFPSLTGDDETLSATQAVYESLQRSVDHEMGDGFQFVIRRPKVEQTGAPQGGFRCSVEARLAGRVFASFHLDIGLGDPVLTVPEWIEGSHLLDFADIPPARIALYPLSQHFAEKIAAYTFPWQGRENTRVKDLVDLVLLIDSGLLEPTALKRALAATFASRPAQRIPANLPSPPLSWQGPFQQMAEELLLPVVDLDAAYVLVEEYWQRHGLGGS